MLEKIDILRKYLAHQGSVRVIVFDATQMVQKARDIHQLSNVATAALGRTLIISTMMASMLKEKEAKLTIQIKGEGPLGSIVVCGDKSLKMKGYVGNYDVGLPLKTNGKLDVGRAVGKGMLTVIKDIGLKEPYIGNCELISSEIAEDFAYYFNVSEQTPSVVSLGVNIGKDNQVQKACGYLIQPLPDCEEKVLDILEGINTQISSVTNLMLDLDNIEDVAKTISGDNQIQLLSEEYPIWACDCNEERIEKTLLALGKKECEKILKENHNQIQVSCNFCNKVYSYDLSKIEQIFRS